MPALRRHFTPSVPEIIAAKVPADSVERYLLDQNSVMLQQNEVMIASLEQVERQTTKTNGRVSQHDLDFAATFQRLGAVEELAKQLQQYAQTEKRTWKWIIGGMSAVISLASPIVYLFADHLLGGMFDHWLGAHF